jgi:RNA polymerase sigma factor (sigma-70 family)
MFRGESQLTTCLCAIARRRLARHYEAERRQAVAESGLALLGGIDGLAGASAGGRDEVEHRDEIVRALGRLPAIHRQVLVMKYLDELPVAQIADELGRSPVQIQSLLQRARDGLRRAIDGASDG